MKSSESREADMLALWIDLAEADQPAPELLLRYARDPESIPPEQRRELQARIANSPELADQLRVIDGFDWSRVTTPAEPPATRRPVRARTPRRSWFPLNWLWAPTLALASVTALVVYPLLQEPSPVSQPEPVASLERSAPPAPASSTPASSTPPSLAPGSEPRPTELAQAETAADAPGSGRTETAESQHELASDSLARESLALAEARQAEAAAEARQREARKTTVENRSDAETARRGASPASPAPQLASAPEPADTPTAVPEQAAPDESRIAQAASPPTADPPARSASPEPSNAGTNAPAAPAAAPAPTRAVTLLAMAEPAYSAPFAGDMGTTLIRGAAGTPTLRAIVPDHLARTSQAQPLLVWHLGRPLQPGERLELLVEREDNGELLVETELAHPASDGLQRLALADHLDAVPEGVPLAWTLLLLDSDDPSRDAIASARLLRVTLTAATRTALARAEMGERPAIYAAAGLWYDALAETLRLRQSHPDNASVQHGLELLLRQGGFRDLVSR